MTNLGYSSIIKTTDSSMFASDKGAKNNDAPKIISSGPYGNSNTDAKGGAYVPS